MTRPQTSSRDGGPAFPVSDQGVHGTFGMSLRDWFAGQVLAGHALTTHRLQPHARVAEKAYAIADAMLKAREETP